MDRGFISKKKIHPKENANFFSLTVFSYFYRTIWNGSKKEIVEEDLPQTLTSMRSSELGNQLQACWEKEKLKTKIGGTPSFLKALLTCYGRSYAILGLFALFVKLIHLFLSPWALGKFVSYFETNQTHISKEEASFFAGVLVTLNLINGLFEPHYILLKTELGIRVQLAISSLLYRKALRLSLNQLSNISTGKIVTAMTKDIAVVNHGIQFGIEFLLECFQIVCIGYLLYNKVGIAGLGGMVLIMSAIPIQIFLGKMIFKKREGCNKTSDQRLQITQEILTYIRVIKMYCWEPFFQNKTLTLRKKELQKLRWLFMFKNICIIIGFIMSKCSFTFMIILYILLGNYINADIIYYSQTCFQKLLKGVIFIPLGIGSIAELMVSMERINAILLSEENQYVLNKIATSSLSIMPQIDFVGSDIQAGEIKILSNIRLKLNTGLNIILGPSGSGKSSLLKAILEEYNATNGKVRIKGTISYADQKPWVFPSSLKQNILFGQKYDKKKYEDILSCCALTLDITNFSKGDNVILSDCGVNLSKGQQSRINLARALYKDSDIYLLDDPLSSLDNRIKNYVFHKSIKEYLGNKLCILVTHDTKFVPYADNVIVMEEGTIIYTGKPSDIPKTVLKEIESEPKEKKEQNSAAQNEPNPDDDEDASSENSELLTHINNFPSTGIYQEENKEGKIHYTTYWKYFKFGGGWYMLITLLVFHFLCESLSGLGEKIMSQWVNIIGGGSNSSEVNTSNNTQLINPVYIESENVSVNSLEASLPTGNQYDWMQNVTNFTNYADQIMLGTLDRSLIYLHYLLLVLLIGNTLVVMKIYLTYYFSMKVSKNLHKSMMIGVLRSKMNFFDTNKIGNILNRFSKDLYVIDEQLPIIFQEGFRMCLVLIICVLLIASVNKIFFFMSMAAAIIFYSMCQLCLQSVRALKRLESSTRSPIVGHLNASLEGLVTIRAYGTQGILINEFDKHLDHYGAAYHLMEIGIRVLNFFLHIFSFMYGTAVLYILLNKIGGTESKSGDVGLVISQSHMICLMLEWALTAWMIVESNMTNFERTVEYTQIKQESKSGQIIDNWPNKGKVEYRNLSLRYKPDGEQVLKNISFLINPGEKIGIVGRTGAGKSSIIVTLFRLYEYDGGILIDDEDIRNLSLEYLRSSIAIIPQDPIVFAGTVRENLDPFCQLTDEEIWNTLETLNIKHFFHSLQDDLSNNKINISVGQQQMICLARAVLRKTKIVVLDEATANMDEQVDLFVNKQIQELFKPMTVITIAHRLKTVLYCDKILVMDKGEVVEFDKPKTLLEDKNTLFFKMVNQKY